MEAPPRLGRRVVAALAGAAFLTPSIMPTSPTRAARSTTPRRPSAWRAVTHAEANELPPTDGAVAVDGATLALGRRSYYAETVGNEEFLSDVLGLLDGPLTATAFAKALATLDGAGMTNLRVALAADATVGGRSFAKGTLVDTGIDVPRGSQTPVGMRQRSASAACARA